MRLTDVVPADLTSFGVANGSVIITATGNLTDAWQVAELVPGAGGVVTVTGVLSGGLHGTVLTNTATMTSPNSDTNQANNVSAVSVTVANVAPVEANDTESVTGNTTMAVTAPGVLANGTDVNGDPLAAVFIISPTAGNYILPGGGSFTCTPLHSFAGVATFTYQANDELADSNSAAVTIMVTAAVHTLYLPSVL